MIVEFRAYFATCSIDIPAQFRIGSIDAGRDRLKRNVDRIKTSYMRISEYVCRIDMAVQGILIISPSIKEVNVILYAVVFGNYVFNRRIRKIDYWNRWMAENNIAVKIKSNFII